MTKTATKQPRNGRPPHCKKCGKPKGEHDKHGRRMRDEVHCQCGRPYVKITPEQEQKLLKHLALDKPVVLACEEAEIATSTFRAECKRNPIFLLKMSRAKNRMRHRTREVVAEAVVQDRNPRIAMEWLKSREPELYKQKSEMHHSGMVKVEIVGMPENPLVHGEQ